MKKHCLNQTSREYAKSKNPEIEVEGEIGYLKGSSEVQSKVEISRMIIPNPNKRFLARTGVNRLAVVFEIHGIVTEQIERLDLEHLKKIAAAVPNIPLVLHGASGLPAEEIKMAIQNGIVNVHINTELRVAYHDTLRKELENKPNETTPYKYLDLAFEEVKKMVKEKLQLFGSVGKI